MKFKLFTEVHDHYKKNIPIELTWEATLQLFNMMKENCKPDAPETRSEDVFVISETGTVNVARNWNVVNIPNGLRIMNPGAGIVIDLSLERVFQVEEGIVVFL